MPTGWSAALWQAPHRSLFFLAAPAALLGPAVWLLPDGSGPAPLEWHRHELAYGMGGATVGGYLLIALPAWTQRPPLSPALTGLVVSLWVGARVAYASALPYGPAISLIYFAVLSLILLPGVLGAGSWNRLPLALAPLALGLSETLPAVTAPMTVFY